MITAASSEQVVASLDMPVRPPHAPDDPAHLARLVRALENEQELPPVVVFRRSDHYQAVTGSHRLAAWAEIERRQGVAQRRFLILTDDEVREGLESMPWLPPAIDDAWPKLARIGDFAAALYWNAERPELKVALRGQW